VYISKRTGNEAWEACGVDCMGERGSAGKGGGVGGRGAD